MWLAQSGTYCWSATGSSHPVVICTFAMLANAEFWSFCSFTVKYRTQNIQNDCHQLLSDSFRVHQISFTAGALPRTTLGELTALHVHVKQKRSFETNYLHSRAVRRRRRAAAAAILLTPPPPIVTDRRAAAAAADHMSAPFSWRVHVMSYTSYYVAWFL